MSHPAVIFTDDFEAGELGVKWDETNNPGGNSLSLVDESEASPVVGKRSLRVTATLNENTGGGCTQWFESSERLFIRFYTHPLANQPQALCERLYIGKLCHRSLDKAKGKHCLLRQRGDRQGIHWTGACLTGVILRGKCCVAAGVVIESDSIATEWGGELLFVEKFASLRLTID